MLTIKELEVLGIEKNIILSGLSAKFDKGKIYYLLGPNGSGKSTLAKAIMGFNELIVGKGIIEYKGIDITAFDVFKRANLGIFMAYQNPVEIPGVSFRNFLRIAYNNFHHKREQLSVVNFKKLLNENAKMFNIDPELLNKNLNENLSGGEKKKMEILQMAVLRPTFAILDEIDSGLDIDASKDVYKGIIQFKKLNPETTLLIITHSLKPFEYLLPESILIMKKGEITRIGDKKLIEEIKTKGFNNL